MDSISTAELIELSLITVNYIDSQFQYWISISFAVIISVYLVGKKLSALVRVTVLILYGLTSTIFALRYAASVDQAFYIAREILLRLPDWPRNGPTVTPIRSLTFIIGIITTVWFVMFSKFTKEDKK